MSFFVWNFCMNSRPGIRSPGHQLVPNKKGQQTRKTLLYIGQDGGQTQSYCGSRKTCVTSVDVCTYNPFPGARCSARKCSEYVSISSGSMQLGYPKAKLLTKRLIKFLKCITNLTGIVLYVRGYIFRIKIIIIIFYILNHYCY